MWRSLLVKGKIEQHKILGFTKWFTNQISILEKIFHSHFLFSITSVSVESWRGAYFDQAYVHRLWGISLCTGGDLDALHCPGVSSCLMFLFYSPLMQIISLCAVTANKLWAGLICLKLKNKLLFRQHSFYGYLLPSVG